MLAHSGTQREGRKRGKEGLLAKVPSPHFSSSSSFERRKTREGGIPWREILLLFFPPCGVCGGGKVFFAVYDRAGSGGIFSRRRAFQSGRRTPGIPTL